MPEGIAIVRTEAVIGRKKRRGCVGGRVHLPLVQTVEAGMTGGGVVARPRRAGGPVRGAHRVRREVMVGLLVHIWGWLAFEVASIEVL